MFLAPWAFQGLIFFKSGKNVVNFKDYGVCLSFRWVSFQFVQSFLKNPPCDITFVILLLLFGNYLSFPIASLLNLRKLGFSVVSIHCLFLTYPKQPHTPSTLYLSWNRGVGRRNNEGQQRKEKKKEKTN